MTGCDFEIQPMVFCRRDKGHLGVHRFSRPIETMILRGQLPMPEDWKKIGVDKLYSALNEEGDP